jgi:hypothetical protein
MQGLEDISAWRSQINSEVVNERSKMPREGELREANLNGAFLLPRLHRAESDLVTTSDVTPLHRERFSTPTDVTA